MREGEKMRFFGEKSCKKRGKEYNKKVIRIRKYTEKYRRKAMREVYVCINSMEKAKGLNSVLRRMDGDFDLIQGKMTIDGKSFLGILSLDLSKPIKLLIHDDQETDEEKLREYLV